MQVPGTYTPLSARKKNWRVIYTRGRWEKKVAELLAEQNIECYCPLRKTERQWSDRKKLVDMPVFSSYLFVKISQVEEFKVRQTMGVINFIYFQGKPAIVKEEIINDIRRYLELCPDLEAVNLQELSAGDRVRIKSGVFSDQQGKVIKIQGKNIILVVEHLGCALVTKVKTNNIALLN